MVRVVPNVRSIPQQNLLLVERGPADVGASGHEIPSSAITPRTQVKTVAALEPHHGICTFQVQCEYHVSLQ